jgi:hypothetical protein
MFQPKPKQSSLKLTANTLQLGEIERMKFCKMTNYQGSTTVMYKTHKNTYRFAYVEHGQNVIFIR